MNCGEMYASRTDRNIGWITEEEQRNLRNAVVGVAGCGGMGGLLAATLARTGIGEIRIADSETFDVSNLNRQFAARASTIGKSKAEETAIALLEIAPDLTLRAFPSGITPETVHAFVEGCTVVCDEIEFWAVGSRILLHQAARGCRIPLFTCSSVGFGSRLFCFDGDGQTIEHMLGLSLEEAFVLEKRIYDGRAKDGEIATILRAMLRALTPELPRYAAPDSYDDRGRCLQRLMHEQRASIIGSNPPLATGLLADRVVLRLLRMNGSARAVPEIPPPPGYLYIDAAQIRAARVFREECSDEQY